MRFEQCRPQGIKTSWRQFCVFFYIFCTFFIAAVAAYGIMATEGNITDTVWNKDTNSPFGQVR